MPQPPIRSTKDSGAPPVGRVWLLGAGPGDPELITYRGVLLLAEADVVLHDALSHPELLDWCPQAEIIDVGKRYGQRATAQEVITQKLIELARTGKKVVRLKGGDPILFARGSEEAQALAEAGIPFEIVPGVTSAVAASAFAGIPLTHRDLSSSVTFITGSDREGKEWSPEAWRKLATATGTICVFMGMRRIEAITRALIDGGRAGETPAAVVRWGARPYQQTVVGTLSTIAQQVRAEGLTSPAIILVGEVVSVREILRWYDNKPLFGKRVLVPRPRHQARETARALRSRAAAPISCPAIEIGPSPDEERLREAVAASGTYDWLIFTSKNGVEAYFTQVDRMGRDSRLIGSARVAVIGPKTGQALEQRNIRPDLVARKFVAENLIEELLAVEPRPKRALLIRAAEARDVLPTQLRAAGVEVDVVAAYVTRPVSGAARAALKEAVESSADVVLLTSSSMVDSVVQALGDGAREALSRLTVVCIGPITAQTAKDHGIVVHVESEVHTVDGALEALEEWLTPHGSP